MPKDNLLAQSALPVGQTPLTTIQAPRVQTSVPNPIDVSNFFRMQQGLQNNISILQREEDLKLRKQTLDLRKYEAMIRDMDAILGAGQSAFGDFYQNRVSSQQTGSGSAASAFGDLDPTLPAHQEIIRRNQGLVDGAQAKIDQLGRDYLTSGAADPAIRFETVRQIRNVIRDTTNKLQSDKDYVKYSTMHRAYNQWLTSLKEAADKGKNINLQAVDEMERRYRNWTTSTGSSAPLSVNDFLIDRFKYDGGEALTNITTDAKNLGLGVEEFKEINTSSGAALRGTQTTRRSLDDITNELYNKYKNDPDAQALYKNAIEGRKDENGEAVGFRDWLKGMAAPYAPADGKEVTEVSESGSPLIKPGKGVSDNNEKSINPYVEYFGYEPKTEGERGSSAIMLDLEDKGFNSKEGGRTGLNLIASVMEDDALKIKYLYYKDGKALPGYSEEADRVEIIRKGGETDEEGEVVPDQVLAHFGKRKDLADWVGKNPPANLIPVTQEVFQQRGLNFAIAGPSHALSNGAYNLLEKLAKDKPEFNVPDIVLTSTYRDPEKNAAVGGVKNSHHLYGDAIDIDGNNTGRALGNWLNSEDGSEWLNDNGYKALWNVPGHEDHIHLQPLKSESLPHDAKDQPTNELVEYPTVRSAFGPDVSRKDVVDRVISRQPNVTNEELEDLLNNPPSDLSFIIGKVKDGIEKEEKDLDRMDTLAALAEVGEISSKEEEEYADLVTEYGSSSVDKLEGDILNKAHKHLLSGIYEIYKGDVRKELIDEVAVDRLEVETELEFKRRSHTRKPQTISFNPTSRGNFVVKRSINDKPEVWDREKVVNYIQDNIDQFSEESLAALVDDDEIIEKLESGAARRVAERLSILEQKTLEAQQESAKTTQEVESPTFDINEYY